MRQEKTADELGAIFMAEIAKHRNYSQNQGRGDHPTRCDCAHLLNLVSGICLRGPRIELGRVDD